MLLKLRKAKRPVVKGGRQTKAIINQCGFPGAVSRVHSANLRNRHMGLIYNNQIIIPEKVHQSMGHSACRHPRKVPGIIFYSRAETGLPKHLNVKIRPLGNPLSLQQLVLALKITYPSSSSASIFIHALLIFSWGTT